MKGCYRLCAHFRRKNYFQHLQFMFGFHYMKSEMGSLLGMVELVWAWKINALHIRKNVILSFVLNSCWGIIRAERPVSCLYSFYTVYWWKTWYANVFILLNHYLCLHLLRVWCNTFLISQNTITVLCGKYPLVNPPGWTSERSGRAAWRLFPGRPDCGSDVHESSPTRKTVRVKHHSTDS